MNLNKLFLRWIAVFGMVMVFAVSGWSAIAYRSASSNSVQTGSLTITKPTGVINGDVMVAAIAVASNTVTVTAPAGWTLQNTQTQASSNVSKLLTYYKIANAEGANYTWSFSANYHAVGGITAFSGVDTASPINVSNGQTTASSTSHATPSITTTVANTMLVSIHEFASSRGWTAPGGMTERVDRYSASSAGNSGISLSMNTVIQASAGATGTKTAVASNSADVGATFILALKPSPVPPIMGDILDKTAYKDVTFTYSPAISTYVTATDGDAITGYKLTTGTIPDGLSFNTTTGAITGTPTAKGSYTLGVKATDNDGDSNEDQFTITVSGTPPTMGNVPNATATVGTAFTMSPAISTYVTATNGDAITAYTLTGSVPGLTFDTSTGAFSGTPTTSGTYNLSVTATDIDGVSNSDSFTITVQGPPTGSVPDQVLTVNTAMTALDLDNYFTSNSGAITYTISPAFTTITGLSYNATSHVLSGTPTTVTTTTSFTVTATNNAGSTSDTFTITVNAAPIASTDPFSLRKQLYLKGNIKTIGNTVLVAPTTQTSNPCGTYTNGAFTKDASNTNDTYYLCDYKVDTTTAGLTNSTTSELNIPSTAKVVWAGLYWQALVANGATMTTPVKIRRDESGTGYTTVYPTEVYYEVNPNPASGYTAYSALADVTSIFTSNGWNEGNYTVANVPVYEGKVASLGTFGAWSLVVVYEDTANKSEKFRSFSIFDGWQKVDSSNDAVITVSGFYTPNRVLDAASSTVSVFTAEGDKNIDGDKLNTKNYNTNSNVVLPAGSTNTFKSLVTGGAARTPEATNNQGIDIQTFNIGDLLKPKQTDMTFTFSSTKDVYWPSMIAVATELVAPEICYDYSYKQDGHYLKTENSGSQLPLLTGYISDSALETSIYLRNNEADILAQGLSFYTDVNTTVFNYIDNTVATSNVNGSVLIPRAETSGGCDYDDVASTPIGCSSGANIRIGIGKDATGFSQVSGGSLGDKEFVYAKFSMDPIGVNGIAEVNQSLGLKLNYYIVPKTGATPIPYDYQFGIDIAMCPPSSGYTPVWGTFNVIDRNAGTYSSNGQTLPTNNLRTQVSRKPFAVDVAAYGKHTDNTYTIRPTADINTTVLVEMIDNDAFHDANASCANPDSNVTKAIYVPLTITAGAGGDMTDPVPDQLLPYYNFAVKNAAFRIWYFNNKDDLLIQNWTANVSDPDYKLNLQSISGLYKSDTHTLCVSDCGNPSSKNCFDCIRANYAKPLCSRDNFAVRPESYDLRIYDVNQSLDQNSTLKNSTKIDLSTQYQYTPQFGASIGRINIAAGYNYRFDMNATGNDTNLAKVPGYTRYFNGANTDYNATMIWEPEVGHITTGCNDTTGKSLSFYVANGQMHNTEQNQSQVGEYRLNVIDSAWTAVDWNAALTGHHTTGNGFEATKEDCVAGDSTVTNINGKVGCVTTSAHVGGGYTYKDHLLRLKPAKFDLNSIVYGVGKTPLLLGAGGSGFVYNSNLGIDNDMAMAVHSYGAIKAVGYGGEPLSNFVKECYATDLNVSISHDANTSLPFIGRMSVAETNGTQVFDSLKFSAQNTAVQTIQDTYFGKASNGQTVPTIRLNFDRNATTPVESQIVHYGDLNVSCLVPSDCNMSAAFNTTPNTAFGSDLMDFNVTHAYGRVVARKVTVMGLIAFDALAKYEVYKNNNLLGTPLAADQFDSDWFVNTLHTDDNYGDATVTVINPVAGSLLPTHTNSINGIETYKFNPFTIRQGYKAHIDTEGWLWYGGINALLYADPNGPAQAGADNLSCQTHPCFDISMGRIIGNTGSAKTESEDHKANKNTSSGTGWNTTREYAPAVR